MDIEVDYSPSPKKEFFVSVGLNDKEAISFDNTSKGSRVIKQVLRETKNAEIEKNPNAITAEWDALVLKDTKFIRKYHVKWIDKDRNDTVNNETWEAIWSKPISDDLKNRILEYSQFVSDHYLELDKFTDKMKKFNDVLKSEVDQVVREIPL